MYRLIKRLSVKQSYALIFTLLVFWASFAYITMNSLIDSQSYYAKLINKSGKQRMLSQKIVLHLYMYKQTQDSNELKRAKELLETFKSDFEYITGSLNTKQAKELYLSSSGLESQMSIFINYLEKYIKSQNEKELEYIIHKSSTLLPLLDNAVLQFQKESEAKTQELQNRELLIYIATVLTILLEAHFFARPVIEKIKMKFSMFKKRLDKQLQSLKLQSKVFHNSNDAILITDRDGIILDVNDAFLKMTKYEKDEVVGKKPSLLKSGKHGHSFYKEMWGALMYEGEYANNIINKDKQGNEFIQKAHISAIYDRDKIKYFVGILSDITQKFETKKKLYKLANYDSLTNIPNRNLMYELLDKSIADAKRENHKVAILYLDLDDFKDINDSLGHSYGDMLLVEIVGLIQKAIRDNDIFCRVGGDEFIMIAKDAKNEENVKILATKILDLLKKPFVFHDITYKLSASMGISVYPDDADDVERMVKHADLAMYKAKHSGKNTFCFFDNAIQLELLEKLEYENSMQQALQNDEFIIYLQPKLNPYTQKVYSCEALVRWKKKGVLIPPGVFIPIAEKSDLILKIGQSVFEKVLSVLNRWQEGDLKEIPISINLSPKQVQYSDILSQVQKLESKIQKNIIFEITEHSLVDDLENMNEFITHCNTYGIKTAIDDFGTGYSSLFYLKKLPIDYIKIDKEFIDDIVTDIEDQIIVKTIIDMSKNLSLKTIIEGVETKEQLEYLKKLKADIIQGYYYSKPLPIKECEAFIKNRLIT